MEKLLVVDGMNLLFQMFYGMPARILGPDGSPIQGTLGFVGALLKIIRMTRPTHVAVLFDGEYCSQRSALDGDYKANRMDYSEMPEEETPFFQLPAIFRALDELGIVHAETTACEADDWIAGYAKRYGGVLDVVIASQDSDFFQLISEHVRVLRYRGKQSTLCDEEYIREKLGISPDQYADFKSLTGDTADNIRGVPKVGPRTAAQLMEEFGNLEKLLCNADQIRKPSVRESVQSSCERIRKNYALIYLEGAEELPYALEDMQYADNGLTTMEVLLRIGLR